MEHWIYIRYSDLFDKRLPITTLKKILRQFKLSNVVFRFAQINTLLALTMLTRSKEDMQKLQGSLISTFIDDETLEYRLKVRYGSAKRDENPIFTRQQALTLLRMCLLECKENAPMIGDDKESGAYTLGQCCLIMNDHLVSPEQEEAISVGTSQKIRKHLALQLAPTLELYNPPNPERAVVRADIMFSDILNAKSTKEKFAKRLPGFHLKAAFRKATGLSLERYRDLVFTTFLLYSRQDCRKMLNNPGLFLIHRSKSFLGSKVKQYELDKYWNMVSIKLSQLPSQMKENVKKFPSALPQHNFALFRKWPFIELDNGNFICVDPIFLVEKLGAGIYHTIRDSLSGNNKKYASTAFGYLFESYVDHIMQQIYPAGSGRLISFPNFQKSKNEAFDGIVICPGGHLIILEYKGGFLTLETKYSGKVKRFRKELDQKFGQNAGVSQLMTKIEQLLDPYHPHHDHIRELQQLGMRITKITPVLVVQEPILHFDFMNWMLLKSFLRFHRRSKAAKTIEIAPLQVIDIGSLERLKPNLINGDFTLEQCLNRRAVDDHDLVSSFHAFMSLNFPMYGKREDSEHESRYESIWTRIRQVLM